MPSPTPLAWRILADAILYVHGGFVAFVVFGLVLILIGLWRRWSWVRSFWFRLAHLLAIAVVVGQAWAGVVCPLTTLENALRRRAGMATYPGGFLAYWVHEILFYRAEWWVFAIAYTLFGALVLLTFVFGRPRRPRRPPAGMRGVKR